MKGQKRVPNHHDSRLVGVGKIVDVIYYVLIHACRSLRCYYFFSPECSVQLVIDGFAVATHTIFLVYVMLAHPPLCLGSDDGDSNQIECKRDLVYQQFPVA
jgi:hypothetical protein